MIAQGPEAFPASDPKSPVAFFGADEPLAMDAGVLLAPFQIAYQTAGTLNAERSNAVLICHALTGDQHFAHRHPITGKAGWWETLVGPGKPIDTDRYFVVCSNVIGSCMGSTGPASPNPATGRAAPRLREIEPWAAGLGRRARSRPMQLPMTFEQTTK